MTYPHHPAPPTLPFGRHRGVPLPDVPSSYLSWALRECKLSGRLRGALVAELQRRGVTPPPPPPPRTLPSCRRCPGVAPLLHWLQDSLGRRRIKASCGRCHRSLGFMPAVSPYTDMAFVNSSPTPVLDALTRL